MESKQKHQKILKTITKATADVDIYYNKARRAGKYATRAQAKRNQTRYKKAIDLKQKALAEAKVSGIPYTKIHVALNCGHKKYGSSLS